MMTRWMGWLAVAALCLFNSGISQAQDTQSPARDTQKRGDQQQKQDRQEGQQRDREDRGRDYSLQDFIKDYDDNEDGAIQRDELPPRLRDDFARLDQNEDGKLDKEELAEHGQRMMERNHQGQMMYIWIWRAQRDKLTRQDMQDAYTLLRQLDEDGDGKITDSEMKSSREKAIKHWADCQVATWDKNGDDQLTKEEVRGALRRRFARLDRDSDGKVSRDEMVEAMIAAGRDRQSTSTEEGSDSSNGRSRERDAKKSGEDKKDEKRDSP